jgi:hypothetical protein
MRCVQGAPAQVGQNHEQEALLRIRQVRFSHLRSSAPSAVNLVFSFFSAFSAFFAVNRLSPKPTNMKTKLILLLSLILVASARAQVQVLPPDFVLFGKTSAEYLAEHVQLILPLSTNGDSLLPEAVPSATEPVYFLQGLFLGEAPPDGVPTYFLPDDVYVHTSIMYAWFDNVGNAVLWTPGQLRDAVASIVDTITNVHATIDGVALTNLLAYRTESPVFSIFFPTNDNIYTLTGVPSYEGLDDPVVAGGYLLMLKPLAAGLHDFRTGFTVGRPISMSFSNHFRINVFHTNHPPVADASATVRRVISPNNHDAEVVLDGSRSSDRDNDPLTYSWVEGGLVIGTGVLSTNVLAVDEHIISLVVNDGKLSATNTITVEVLTPCEALGELGGAAEAAKLSKKIAKPLVDELREACAAFEHGFKARHHDRQGHLKHAIRELMEFQHEVREELGRSNPALAALLIDGAQEIIDAVKPVPNYHHGEQHGDDRD